MQGAWKLLFVLSAVLMIAIAVVWPFGRSDEGASQAQRRWELRWINRHRTLRRQVEAGPCDLIFVGDSITQNWETFGSEIWLQYYESRRALNFGISSDLTQHVLWRINDTNFTKANPKLFVVLAGTNNSADHSAEEIATGVEMIVRALRHQVPEAKVLLMAIFPRGEKADDPRRLTNDAANDLLRQLTDEETVFFADINSALLTPSGVTNLNLMPDALHPNKAGYAEWAAAIEPTVKELLGEAATVNTAENE